MTPDKSRYQTERTSLSITNRFDPAELYRQLSLFECSSRSALHLQIHQLGMWHHILVQIGHNHEGPCEDQEYDEHAKRERQDVVGAVRSGRDMKKEYQVHSHLGNGENGESGRYARCPDRRGV